jgi:hypothetical protein
MSLPEFLSTMPRRAVLVAFSAALLGCPPGLTPSRDGGRPCARSSECNPAGATCGVVFECVLGFCAQTPIVRACPDGSYPASDASTGNCVLSEDCNPMGACGAIIACVNYVCDPEGPRINVPCADASPDADAESEGDAGSVRDAGADGGDARSESDAGAGEAGAGDAAPG